MSLATQERVRCFLRCIVHTCYREIRHIGPPDDPAACLVLQAGPFVDRAQRVRDRRSLLKGTQLFLQSASAGTAGEVVAPTRPQRSSP